jgi:hypothetical protein
MPTELEDLLGGEQICERLDLSDGPVWEVAILPNAEETRLRNFGPVVHLLLSREDQKKLAYPEVQGVYFTTNRSGSGLIRYFIEKDFPCIHPRAADALEGPSLHRRALFPRKIDTAEYRVPKISIFDALASTAKVGVFFAV